MSGPFSLGSNRSRLGSRAREVLPHPVHQAAEPLGRSPVIQTASGPEMKVMDKDRITGAAKDAAGKVEGALGRATGDASTEASGRAREAAGTVQNLYGQAKDAARDIGDAAGDYAQDAVDAGSKAYRDGSQAVASAVQNQPLGTLLIAGAVGFALALMLNRQPRRRKPARLLLQIDPGLAAEARATTTTIYLRDAGGYGGHRWSDFLKSRRRDRPARC